MDDAEPTVDVARFLSVLLMYFYDKNIEPNLNCLVFGTPQNKKLFSEEEMGERVNPVGHFPDRIIDEGYQEVWP